MTQAEIEVSLKRLTDHQIVWGELLNRLEQVVARNSEAIAQNTEAIARNTEAIARNSEAIVRLTDGLQVMQAAMQHLFEHMDRFIQGLEGNGHRPR